MKWKQCFIRQLRVLRLSRYSLTDSCDTMSEQDNKPKQRRNVGDKMKDLYNTYVRNEEMAEHETSKTEQSASDTTEQEVAMAENVADDTVARLTKERDELREQLVRQVAELDNYRRRSLKPEIKVNMKTRPRKDRYRRIGKIAVQITLRRELTLFKSPFNYIPSTQF